MANYAGHSAVATIVGASCALTGPFYDLTLAESMAAGMCGFTGAVIPDADIKHSVPGRVLRLASIPLAGLLLSQTWTGPVLVGLLWGAALWLTFWLIINNVVKHRGWTHSWYGAACAAVWIGHIAYEYTGSFQLLYFYAAFAGGLAHFLTDDITGIVKHRKLSRLVTPKIWITKNSPGFLIVSAPALVSGWIMAVELTKP